MNPTQTAAFFAASGVHADGLSFDIRLFVGGIALIISVLLIAGLTHLLNSDRPNEKQQFLFGIFGLAFTLMMIFVYIA